jgi:hypothetical protein
MLVRRWITLLSCLAAFAAVGGPAAAGPLRFVSGFYPQPYEPNATEPTSLVVNGWFPFPCGTVTDTVVVGDTLALTLRPASGCADSSLAWSHTFRLGLLPAGPYPLTLRVTCVTPESTVVGEQSFALEVRETPAPPPPPPPQEPPSWLLRCLSGWSTEPSPPNDSASTTLWLHGWFPYPCGEVVANQIDPAHLEITLRRGAPCGDDTTTWRKAFTLGTLPEGLHQLTLNFVVEDDPADSLAPARQATFGFWVLGDSTGPPPPPPPPPPPAGTLRYVFSGFTLDPVHPTPGQPVALEVSGWFPYACGAVTDTTIVGDTLALTLRPALGCPDSSSTWSHRFHLGTLAAGNHALRLRATVIKGDSTLVGEAVLTVEVRSDWSDPPPPPPPPDSLLSPGHPNPFAEATEFSVRMDREARTTVQIYDVTGRLVTTVFDGPLATGVWQFRWNGKRADGVDAASGIYFCRVAYENRVLSRRLVMLQRR